MAKRRVKVTKTTTERFELAFNREALMNLFHHANLDIPEDARIVITVPGGGDWSNTQLDVGTDVDLIVIYEEVTKS